MDAALGLPFPADQKKGLEGSFETKNMISIRNYCCSSDHHHLGCLNNKRSYEEGVTKINQRPPASHSSFPLLLWAGQPNEDDDDDNDREGKRKKTSCSSSMDVAAGDAKEENDDHVIVGWPPIKSWRRKMLQPNQGGQLVANIRRHRHMHAHQASRRDSKRPEIKVEAGCLP